MKCTSQGLILCCSAITTLLLNSIIVHVVTFPLSVELQYTCHTFHIRDVSPFKYQSGFPTGSIASIPNTDHRHGLVVDVH
jgi:hypothetical protein